jgi:aminopeptidase N
MIKTNVFPAIILFLFLITGATFAKDKYPVNQGIDILHYCFQIHLNDSTDHIEGTAELSIELSGSVRIINLDLKGIDEKGRGMIVNRVASGATELTFKQIKDQVSIEVPDTVKTPGIFIIKVEYSGIPANGLIISRNKNGDRTFFADNWPDRARHWLPCIDHPSDKATVEFIVSAPEKYKVVSNGILTANYPEKSVDGARFWITHWKEEVPIPTKVMVIGVADFAWEVAGYSKDIPVQSWIYSKDYQAGFLDYEPAVAILTYFQDLIGPYSYKKLANVQSKTMFGGMENSGCIFYYEKSVTGKNSLHSLMAHEIAHQWFGDAVTEQDWHHIWLSEGFATYLEACYADSMIPGKKLADNMAGMRKDVIRYFERTNKPVIDTTITNFMQLLSTNSYQKGAWFLHMLRQELGEGSFWKGIRQYYATYRDKNAMTADFQLVMEEVSGMDLAYFFKQWLEIPGQPVIKCTIIDQKSNGDVELEIEQMQDQHLFVFKLPLEVRDQIIKDDKTIPSRSISYQVPINERKVKVTLPANFRVAEIKLDPKSQLLYQEFSTEKGRQ